ncbi:carbonic anhydrase 9 [Pseudophryne corroboree]|uniref:carbonic anhydrase 9 n=1 Tax=Pseudophryne corroboree TaxID=495146 RepID=UPI0030814E84
MLKKENVGPLEDELGSLTNYDKLKVEILNNFFHECLAVRGGEIRAAAGEGGAELLHWLPADVGEWNKDFPDCGGRAQSPINVDTQKTVYDRALTTIQLSGYDVTSGETLKLKNNGHTVVLQLPDNLRIVEGLTRTYDAVQLHFHWGSRASPGSEHTVNGQKFPGEIHVVHYSTEYESLDDAITQPGGLAVLAAFIEEGPDDNEPYGHLLSYLRDVREAGECNVLSMYLIAQNV